MGERSTQGAENQRNDTGRGATKIHEDNQEPMKLANSTRCQGRSKHIAVRYHLHEGSDRQRRHRPRFQAYEGDGG